MRGSVAGVLGEAPLVAFVASADLERAHAFYRGVLGLTHVETTPFANVYDARGTTLRVAWVDSVVVTPYTVAGWVVPDVAAAVQALAERGVAFLRYPGMGQDDGGVWTSPSGARVAWFCDPDGNVLSVTELAPPVSDASG